MGSSKTLKNAFKKHPLQNRTNVQIKGGGVKGLLNNVQKNCTFLTGRLPEDMTETAFGKFYTFKPPRHITLGQEDCMTIVIVQNFTFSVFAHDEKFFLKNFNPLGPPINYRTFHGHSQKNFYQEMTLTRHRKLNLFHRPCNEESSYSFTNCVKDSLSKQVNSGTITLYSGTQSFYQVGCNLPWGKRSQQKGEICRTKQQFRCLPTPLTSL